MGALDARARMHEQPRGIGAEFVRRLAHEDVRFPDGGRPLIHAGIVLVPEPQVGQRRMNTVPAGSRTPPS